jgi:hypothetical protein
MAAAPTRVDSNHRRLPPSPRLRPHAANCSAAFEYHLSRAGIPLEGSGFSAMVVKGQMVTINVLVAVGLNGQQMQAGLHQLLAGFLSNWANVRKLLAAGGLDVSRGVATAWLQRPEVIYGSLGSAAAQGAATRKANTALAVGLAVPLGVCLFALAGTVATLAVRSQRAPRGAAGGTSKLPAVGDSAGAGGGASASGRSRRGTASSAGSGKRRYIAPPLQALAHSQNIEELAAANLRAAGTSGGGSGAGGASTSAGGGLTAAVVAAHRGALGDDDSEEEADLRPRLRSLGDSVTSAARFEADEPGEGGAAAVSAAAGSDGDEGGDAAPPLLSRRAAHESSGVARSSLGSLASSQTGGSGAAPWPGPVEAPPEQSGPSVIMGAANPPRVGTLASPFGTCDFQGLSGSAAGGAAGGSGGRSNGTGACGATTVIAAAPDGAWVAPGLQDSIALMSSSGAAAGHPHLSSGRGGGA